MKSFCRIILVCLFLVGWSEIRTLREIEKEFISKEFTIIKNRNQIRPEILSPFEFPKGIPIANPEEAFNSTDVIDPKMTSRRLIFAGEANDMVFVYSESGGYASQTDLMIVKLNRGNIVSRCYYSFGLPEELVINNLEALKKVFTTSSIKIFKSCDKK